MEKIAHYVKKEEKVLILKYVRCGTLALLDKNKLTLAIPKKLPTKVKGDDGITRLCITFNKKDTDALKALLDGRAEQFIKMEEEKSQEGGEE